MFLVQSPRLQLVNVVFVVSLVGYQRCQRGFDFEQVVKNPAASGEDNGDDRAGGPLRHYGVVSGAAGTAVVVLLNQ